MMKQRNVELNRLFVLFFVVVVLVNLFIVLNSCFNEINGENCGEFYKYAFFNQINKNTNYQKLWILIVNN